jgi:hypothetical protein
MPTQKELAELRGVYLNKREELLKRKVNSLGLKLYDKVFEQYLVALEKTPDGKLLYTQQNLNLIQGLDSVYNVFNQTENITVIKQFFDDLNGVHNQNVKYFNNINKEGVRANSEAIKANVDKQLGIKNGVVVKDGFADKFINDKTVVKDIKRQTIKAISSGKSFDTFRKELKQTIVGNPKLAESGKLQQYYRTYAYDTYMQVDRTNQDLFAKKLKLRYFIYAGTVIKTTRPLCRKCVGKIVDTLEFGKLKYDNLKLIYRPGLDSTWKPNRDLGQYNCRHRKDYVTDSVARQLSGKKLDVSELTF